MQVDVAFMPTPVYVKAFGKAKAKEEARKCKRDTVSERLDSLEEEDPLEIARDKAWNDLKLAAMMFGSGFLFGMCLMHILMR